LALPADSFAAARSSKGIAGDCGGHISFIFVTHKHAKVKAWLARRPRFHVHFTPTYASWLNLVERWFGIITQQAIRRGSLTKVKTLIQRIEQFVEHYNKSSRPFVWTATADSILAKVERLALLISGTRH
jgi:hypothetical protein